MERGAEQRCQLHDFSNRQRPHVARLQVGHRLQVEDGLEALRPWREDGTATEVFVFVGGVLRQTVELIDRQVQLDKAKVVIGHGEVLRLVAARAGQVPRKPSLRRRMARMTSYPTLGPPFKSDDIEVFIDATGSAPKYPRPKLTPGASASRSVSGGREGAIESRVHGMTAVIRR